VEQDEQQSDRWVYSLRQSGTTLPSPAIYTATDPRGVRLQQALRTSMYRTFRRLERDSVRATRGAEAVYALEARLARGFDPGLGSYVGAFGEGWMDASLLAMARLGYRGPLDPRVVGTADRIWGELGRNGLLLRYRPEVDGLPSREGAFGICAFWAVELLALQGRTTEAAALFDRALLLANDVGLLAEEFDPGTGEALGNVPQAFTHAGLISAALALA